MIYARISTLFIPIVFIFLGCTSIKKTKKDSDPEPAARLNKVYYPAAWNEDTVLPMKLFFLEENKFTYEISFKDSNKNIINSSYYGTYQNKTDTIYLMYKDGKRPQKFSNFLIPEISGKYLIQYYSDLSKRIFLRIVRPASR